MSTHYETLRHADTYREAFGVEPPDALGERLLWPRKSGGFIVQAATAAAILHSPAAPAQPPKAPPALDPPPAPAPPPPPPVCAGPAGTDSGTRTGRGFVPAQWGLVPHWVKSASDAKLRAPKLAHAKSDLASTGTAFRDAWLNGQRCIVPLQAFFVDDWRSGKAVPTRIARVDGRPMGVAGLWARWQGAEGEVIVSYCLLTLNANNHALLNRYGPPGSEKSMPAILNEGAYDAWLTARHDKAKEFMRQYAAQKLTANPVEKKADKVPKGWLD